MVLAYYEHKFSPFLIRFTEDIGIRYYGVAYALGFLIAGFLLHQYFKRGRSSLNPDAQFDLLFWIIVGTMVGGRLGYFLFYQPAETLVHDPLAIFRVWDGGMASHGGFIGVILGLWWFAHRQHISVLKVGDIVATLAPPGLLLGRIANFINGELWGKVTDVWWAWRFPLSEPGVAPDQVTPRHPSQLYEAALEGFVLMLYTQWRIWRTPGVLKKPGRLAGEFLVGYAIARVVCEQFRQNDAGIEPMLGLNRGAWLSFLVAAGGVVLIVLSVVRKNAATPASSVATKPASGAKR